ncbi:MAG: cytochrome P450 [Candidatus Tectomicrobia bacterium]
MQTDSIDTRTIDLAVADLAGDEMHSLMHHVREQTSVAEFNFAGMPAWVITRFADLELAYRDGERFPPELVYQMSMDEACGRSFISMPQEEHNRYRQLATPAFRLKAVKSHGNDHLVNLANTLIDEFVDAGETDLVESFTRRFPLLIICRMLGLPTDIEETFGHWALDLLSFPSRPEAAVQAGQEMAEFLRPLLEQRRLHPQEDVLTELAQAELDGQQLSDEEIISHIRLLFPTGADTTYLALGNLLYTLLSERSRWQALIDKPELIDGAVEELLRYETPVPFMPRLSAARDIEFCGHHIPANSMLMFCVGSGNRDNSVFDNPNEFDMRRKAKKILSFGPGLRTCPGMHIARRNMQVALAVLLQRLPGLTLIDPQAAQPRGCNLRGPKALRVKF